MSLRLAAGPDAFTASTGAWQPMLPAYILHHYAAFLAPLLYFYASSPHRRPQAAIHSASTLSYLMLLCTNFHALELRYSS